MKVRGHFEGAYEMDSMPEEIVEIKRAFIFSGQGSSYPGMFREYFPNVSTLQKYFQLADRMSANFDLLPFSKYIFDADKLPPEMVHIYRNCALYIVQVALAEFLRSLGIEAQASTAHSFGECAALVHEGVIDFDTMMSVVVYRSLICPPANKLGWMVAVNGDQIKLRQLLGRDGVYLANINSKKQLVISVSSDAKESVLEYLRNNKLPHILLNQLPQPYHSPLMLDAQQKAKEKFDQLRLKPGSPIRPLLSGVTHQWINESNYSKIDYADIISRQLTEPVYFLQQLNELSALGISSYYEIGPGKMLETSIRSSLRPRPHVYRAGDFLLESLAPVSKVDSTKLDGLAKSRWFEKIKSAIQKITGYQSEDIGIQHSFQSDLGIDSIKKAEILFKILSEEKMGSNSDFATTRFNTIYQAVEYLENYSEKTDPLMLRHEMAFSILAKGHEPAPLPHFSFWKKEMDEFSVIRVKLSADFLCKSRVEIDSSLLAGKQVLLVIESSETSLDYAGFLLAHHQSYKKWMEGAGSKAIYILLVDHSKNQAAAPVACLWKSLHKESARFNFGYINAIDTTLDDLQLLREALSFPSRDIYYFSGKRCIGTFSEIDAPEPMENATPRNIVSVGGSRGINFEILRNFPNAEQSELLLLGRRSESDPELKENLSILRTEWKCLHYACVDASNLKKLQSTITGFQDLVGNIDLIINACGFEISQAFESREPESVDLEFKNKIHPFKNIERIKNALKIPKAFHYSSTASYFGNKGQAIYCYNNAIIEQDLSEGSHAIAWAPWESVGMTHNAGILQLIRERGISILPLDEGVRIAAKLMSCQTKLPNVIFSIDAKDQFLFAASHASDESYQKVLGNFSNVFDAVFYKDIYLREESFLDGHVVFDKKVLPAAYLLAQIMTLSWLQFSKMMPLRNFRITNMLIVEEEHCLMKLQAFFRPPHEINIFSLIPHAAASFDAKPGAQAKEAAPKLVAHECLDISTLYKDDVFKFGEHFRLIKKCFLTKEKQVWVSAQTAQLPRYMGHRFFDFYLALFETAFQSITVQAFFLHNAVTLPMGINRINHDLEIPVTEKVFIYPLKTRVEGNILTCDIAIANDGGEVFCKLLGVRVRLLVLDAKHRLKTIPIRAPHS